jgi:hypothetical protein
MKIKISKLKEIIKEAIEEAEHHKCEGCGKVLSIQDKSSYEAEGGDGWPSVCEDCAEDAALSEASKDIEVDYIPPKKKVVKKNKRELNLKISDLSKKADKQQALLMDLLKTKGASKGDKEAARAKLFATEDQLRKLRSQLDPNYLKTPPRAASSSENDFLDDEEELYSAECQQCGAGLINDDEGLCDRCYNQKYRDDLADWYE